MRNHTQVKTSISAGTPFRQTSVRTTNYFCRHLHMLTINLTISVCAFPYVIAFTSNSMEIRLIVNGNLVHTMTMPKLQLVACKNDIFFATTAPEFFPNRADRLLLEVKQCEHPKYSPPLSPNCKYPNLKIICGHLTTEVSVSIPINIGKHWVWFFPIYI